MTVTVPNREVRPVRSSAELLAEKVRLQRLEQDIAQRLEQLRMKSCAGSPKPQQTEMRNNSIHVPKTLKFTAKLGKENSRLPSEQTNNEGNNLQQLPDDKELLSNIHLASIYNIEEENIGKDMCNQSESKRDFMFIEDRIVSKLCLEEPCLYSPELSFNILPFHIPAPTPLRKLSFCSSPVQGIRSLQNNHRKNIFGFRPYETCLLHFSSYRLNPKFKCESGQSLACNAFTSKVNMRVQLCKYDLTGTCNDDQCKWQHSKNYICSPADIVADLLSFCPDVASVSPTDSHEKSREKLYKYANALLNRSNDLKQTLDDTCKVVCRHLRIVQPHFVQLYKRHHRLKVLASFFPSDPEEPSKVARASAGIVYGSQTEYQEEDSFVNPETDVRYFEPEKGFSGLEDFLLQNPGETKLWLKLASHYMNSSNGNMENLNLALDVLSRALETNRDDVELWQRYLTLFSGHPDSKDILSLCQQALEFTKHYSIWWKYLDLSVGFRNKTKVCHEIFAHLLSPEGCLLNSDPCDLSHRFLETFLYLLQLHLQTGHTKIITVFFNLVLDADKLEKVGHDTEEWSLLTEVLTKFSGTDLILVWLCYLHFLVHGSLPSCLFKGNTNQPSILTHKEPFVISFPAHMTVDGSLSSVLTQAISSCEELASSQECWPLYLSSIQFHLHMNRTDLAVEECRKVCSTSPIMLQTWLHLTQLYFKGDRQDEAEKAQKDVLEAVLLSPHLCNTLATFHLREGCTSKALDILALCVKPYFNLPNSENGEQPTAIFYKLLLNHHYGEDIPLAVFEKQKEGSCPEEDQTFLWLNYALYLEYAQDNNSAVVDVYESALVSVKLQSNVELIWWRYLQYSLRSSTLDSMHVQELVFQCLERVPVVQPVAHWSGRTRLNYRFHNNVIQMYCQALQNTEEKSAFCQELLQRMPRNEGLLQSLLLLILEEEGKREALNFLESHLGAQVVSPTLWRIAISLAYKEKDFAQVRSLYYRALKVIPYTRCLWMDLLVLESGEQSKVDALLERCRELGISLAEGFDGVVEKDVLPQSPKSTL